MFDIGVDVSFYQDKNETPSISMDFLKAKLNNAKFAYIKSSQATYTDSDFNTYKVNVKASGLPFGFYHFLTWNISGKTQANYYWNLVKDTGFNLPMVVDFEKNPLQPITPPNAKYILKDFLEELKRLSNNSPIIIYSGNFFWGENCDKDEYWKQYGYWVASYTTQAYMEEKLHELTPFEDWIFWQKTDKGNGLLYGAESLNIDIDYLNGTIEDFLAQLAPDKSIDEYKALVVALEARVTQEVAERQALYKLIENSIALLNSYKE